MQVTWEFTGCDETDEFHFEQLWEQRYLQLEAKGSNWEDAASELLIAIEYDGDTQQWRTQTVLYLADRTVATEQTATNAEVLFDNIVAALSQKIDLVAESDENVPRERIQGLEKFVGSLQEARERGNSRAFMARLSPIVQRFGSYAEREIRIRQRLGLLHAEHIEPPDVLDEVLVRSWDRFPTRSREKPLDLWLLRLIDELIDELGRNVAEQSLEEDQPVPPDEQLLPSESDQWTEQPCYPETIRFAELLPGDPGIESLDEVDASVHRSRLTDLLGTLTHSQRQALLLLTNYGYNEAQIADFQNRSADEVRADINAARETLRQELEGRDWLDDTEEQYAKKTIRRKQQIQPGSRKAL